MIGEILLFEWRYYSRQTLFLIAAILFFLLGILGTMGNFGGLDVQINTPFVITYFLALLSLKSIFVVTIFCAHGVLRDKSNRMEEIIYSTSVGRLPFLFSRFVGLFLASWAVLLFAGTGMLVGSLLADSAKLGPFQLRAYIEPLVVLCAPNVLFSSAICFSIAILTRSVTATYVGGVLLYALYFVGSILGNSPLLAGSTATGPEGELLPILLDPYGLVAFFDQARYWTSAQKNTLYLPLEGHFLLNRLFWIGIVTALFLLVFKLFRFRLLSRKKEKALSKDKQLEIAKPYHVIQPSIEGISYQIQSILAVTRSEALSIFKSLPFMVLMMLWVLILGIDITETLFRGMMGTVSYTTTGKIILHILDPLSWFGILLIVFYTAEQFWREKTHQMHEILYVSPSSNASLLLGKWLALSLMILVVVALGICVGITIQAFSGYQNFELQKYALLLYYGAAPLILIAAFALMAQLLIGHKYAALFLTGIFFYAIIRPNPYGLEHPLLRIAMMPPISFSDLNGFGHFAKAFNWRFFYWLSVSALLFLGGHLFWRRSSESQFSKRFRLKSALNVWQKSYILMTLAAILTSGGYIYYQTNILNTYRTQLSELKFRAAYEKKYCEFKWLQTPDVNTVKTTVDIYPQEQRYTVNGRLTFENNSDKSIETILIGVDPEVSSVVLHVPQSELVEKDRRFNHSIFKLEPALEPGEQRSLSFSTNVLRNGFAAFNSEHSIQSNGSYVELEKYLPFFGYSGRIELDDEDQRLEVGLSATPKSGPAYADSNYSWINFETIISTSSDQTVITIGNLIKNWTENDRGYFHYKSQSKIPYMFAFSSAEYQKELRTCNDVALEIYYHQGHGYNVDRLLNGSEDALRVFEEKFGNYQYDILRFVEIPHYIGAATAYPTTVFATSDFGFLLDVRDSTRLDYISMLPAHEIAHQWWPGQVEPIYQPGYKFLTESMAQFAEVLVLRETGKEEFLREFAVNELDMYAMSRGYTKSEPALRDVYGRDNSFVPYNKGAIVMSALADLLGQEIVIDALKEILQNHRIPSNRLTIDDFLTVLYSSAPPETHSLIREWLEDVFTYNLNVSNVEIAERADGKYRVVLTVLAEKQRWSGNGESVPAELREDLQIGLFTAHPDIAGTGDNLLYLKKHALTSGENNIEVIVDERPGAVGVDPMHLRLDLNRYDNFTLVE